MEKHFQCPTSQPALFNGLTCTNGRSVRTDQPVRRDYDQILECNKPLQELGSTAARIPSNPQRVRQPLYHDRAHRARFFQPGDYVYLRLGRGYATQESRQVPPKHAARYAGRFKILQRVGRLAYKLDFPASCRIHPVVSVERLGHKAVFLSQLSAFGMLWSYSRSSRANHEAHHKPVLPLDNYYSANLPDR